MLILLIEDLNNLTQEINQMKAILSYDEAKDKYVISIDGQKFASSQYRDYLIKKFEKEILTSRLGKKMGLSVVPELEEGGLEVQASEKAEAAEVQSEFDVNKRFGFLEDLGSMVLNKVVSSMIVSGAGGLGKTYTVMKLIRDFGLREDVDYVRVTGSITPKALYRLLFNYSDKLLIFDDCDQVFKDPIAANLLKAALDSRKTRRIHWQSDRMDEELPDWFDFKGQVFFITNVPLKKFSQALRSRSYGIDLSMTFEDKMVRMRTIIEDICPDNDMMTKQDALDFIEEHGQNIPDLNFRTLEKTIKIREGAGKNWKELAKYSAMEG